MNKAYVLVRSENDYNQHGEYYVHVWTHQPTPEELSKHGVDYLGRKSTEDTWYDVLIENVD